MLVDREQSNMSKHIKACAAGNSVTLCKESHIAIKRAVVDVAGEQRTDAHWVCLLEMRAVVWILDTYTELVFREQTLTDAMIENIPQHLRQNILKALRTLVIAFANLTAKEKAKLTTASELVKKKDW